MLTPSVPESMGAVPREDRVSFWLWAPDARAVFVTGSFNDWAEDAAPMTPGGGGEIGRRVPLRTVTRLERRIKSRFPDIGRVFIEAQAGEHHSIAAKE